MNHNSASSSPISTPWAWPITRFFVLAYAIAWGAFGLLGLIARQSGIPDAQTLLAMGEAFQFEGITLSAPAWIVYLLTRLADFAFSIAGVVMIAVTGGRPGLRQLWQRLTRWRIRWYWYVMGLAPLGLYGVATAVAGAYPAATITINTVATALFSLHAGFFVSLFLRGAIGEELGLRGFALPRLQEHMSPFRASLIIGVLWGAWHLPVLIGRDLISIVVFSFLSIGLSMVFTWLFNGSGGSLIPVLLFHATQNWEEGFEVLFPTLVGTEWELVSTLALLAIGLAAGVVVWRNGRFAAGCESLIDTYNTEADVERVCTHSDFRRRGLARSVTLACLHQLQEIGMQRAYITGYSDAAVALYASLG